MPDADQQFPAQQGAIDADAFNAFESAGWEQQASTYDRFIGGITRGIVRSSSNSAGVGAASRRR